jgi:hypothetical protein
MWCKDHVCTSDSQDTVGRELFLGDGFPIGFLAQSVHNYQRRFEVKHFFTNDLDSFLPEKLALPLYLEAVGRSAG